MKKVLLLLANGFEILEASVFIDVIGWNQLEGDHTTELFSCGLSKEVKSSFNQRFLVDYLIKDIDEDAFDALAIPGGFEEYGYYNDAYNEAFLNIIKAFKAQDKMIASICVGALPIGKSGILKNKKGTTYTNPIRRNTLKSYGVELSNEAVVIDAGIITSKNPSTAIEVAMLLLEQLTSKENAQNVKRLMGFI